MEQLKNELRGIVASIGELPQDFDASADLYSDLKLGSFQAVDIMMMLEERYKISIPDDQYSSARSLDGLTEMMAGLLQS